MLDQETRKCPRCTKSIKGEPVNSVEPDFKKFTCTPCEEVWYENTQYCLAKFEYPEEAVN